MGFLIKKKNSVVPLFCFIPAYYLVAAERNSKLSVSAGVEVVLWLLVCLSFGLAYIDFLLFKCARLGRNNFLCSGFAPFCFLG